MYFYHRIIKKGQVAAMLLVSFVSLAAGTLLAQVPQRPQPQRLVNDLAGIFTPSQNQNMERALVIFADSTSNQIAVVTVPELYGMDKAQLAYEIGEQWGVGQQKFNNGVVILIKPKTQDSKGEVFIATGYGLEGVLTDAVCKRIIEQYMIPSFRADNYYAGTVKALNAIMPLAAGEISTDEFAGGDDELPVAVIFFLIFIVIIFVALLKGDKNGPKNMGGGNHKGPTATDLFMLGLFANSTRPRHSSGWGSSSGGFGGGGFGGFGGFGGGSFGGGGAGGSW